MKLLLLDRRYIAIDADEKKRMVTAKLSPWVTLGDIWNLDMGQFMKLKTRMILGLTCLIQELDNKPYRAVAVCDKDDVFDCKIGEEIAYLRLCRRYLKLMESVAMRSFFDFLSRYSDYSKNYDDITFKLPWGQKRQLLTEQFIQKRLDYLYHASEPKQKEEKIQKILPCPFCLAKNLELAYVYPGNWQIQCHHCDASGPKCKGHKWQAIEAWNKVKR